MECTDTDSFRSARFINSDLRDVTIRSCGVGGLKIVDCDLGDVRVSGFMGNVVVNGVDVTAFVEAELDRQHPERRQLRAILTADDHRAMWNTIERLWPQAIERAQRLREALLNERVDDEWSFVETLRHLVYATDSWIRRAMLEEPRPYHPLGYPQTGFPAALLIDSGFELDARPTFDEVIEARLDRMALMRHMVDGVTDEQLLRMCTRSPAPDFPDERYNVGQCLRTVMAEECEHYRYAMRDLGVLEARDSGLRSPSS